MSELGRFLPEDQDLLVGLFYRIGRWMSAVDDSDTGDESETLEEKQMLRILGMLSTSAKAGALCNDIASEALRHKGSWARWDKMHDSVIDDVKRAKVIVFDHGTPAEFQLFGKSLVTIATSVARAYRESTDLDGQELGFLSWLTEKSAHINLAMSDREGYKDLNISPAEDNALIELTAVLKGTHHTKEQPDF